MPVAPVGEPSSSKLSTNRRSPQGELPSLSTSIRRGAFWSSCNTLALRLVNIAVTAVVAHILAPRDFGIFAVALTAFSIVACFGELGVGACIIRADLDIDAIAPTMVTVSLVTSAILAGAMAVSARHIAIALGSAAGAGSVRVMALVVLINGFFTIPSGQLTRDFKQDKLFLANIIGLVPSTAALLFLAKSGSGAMAFAWSRVIAQFIMGCAMVAFVPKIYLPGLARKPLSLLFKFGLPLAAANIIYYILINVDYAFVGHLMGAVALGVYVLAFTIASAPGLLLGNVINSIAMPAFSRVKQDPDLLQNAMARALRAVSLILMPMCSLMMALALPLVLTLYGARWAAAAEVLSILSLYGAISTICVLFANMLTSLGKARLTLIVQLLWLGTLIPAMALGVHRDGIVGAAVAHIVVIGLLVLPSYLFALKKATEIHFSILGRAVLPPLLAASVAALAARAAAAPFASPLVQLVAGLTVGSLIYVVAAAPQFMAWLSQEQIAKLHALPLFRFYDTAGRMVRFPNARGPIDRSGEGRYRARHASSARWYGPAAARFALPSAGEAFRRREPAAARFALPSADESSRTGPGWGIAVGGE